MSRKRPTAKSNPNAIDIEAIYKSAVKVLESRPFQKQIEESRFRIAMVELLRAEEKRAEEWKKSAEILEAELGMAGHLPGDFDRRSSAALKSARTLDSERSSSFNPSAAKTERNAEIYKRRMEGDTFGELASEYTLSPNRVREIFNREKYKRKSRRP